MNIPKDFNCSIENNVYLLSYILILQHSMYNFLLSGGRGDPINSESELPCVDK